MPTNPSSTVQAVIKYRSIFFRIMDHNAAASKGGAVQFTRAAYNRLLDEKARHLNAVEQAKLYDALGYENLVHAGLTLYDDPNSGRFELIDWVIDMLRFFDDRRLKSLSSADLDKLHDQIAHTREKVFSHKVIWVIDDEDRHELISMVHDTFRSVASRMTQNVRALDGHSKRLAELASSSEYEQLRHSEQYVNALREIMTIYERNIIPTMHFLDPMLDLKKHDGKPPMAMMEEIQKLFEEKQLFDDAAQMRRVIIELYAQTSEVKLIRDSLDVYVALAVEQRKLYNSIEHRYNRLKEEVESRQDGRQKGTQLKPIDSLFNDAHLLFGLKGHNSAHQANIDWPKQSGRVALDERLRTRLDSYTPVEAPVHHVAKRKDTSAKREASMLIQRIRVRLRSFDVRSSTSDLHLDLHNHLHKRVKGYKLSSLVDALEMVKSRSQWKRSTRSKTIVFNNQELTYYPLSFSCATDIKETA